MRKKFKEQILWNIHESQISAELFAKITAEENELPQFMEHEIAFAIKKQILSSKQDKIEIIDSKECIKTIDIDIRIQDVHYKDKFQWDILDQTQVPEVRLFIQQFAYILCEDLGLSLMFA